MQKKWLVKTLALAIVVLFISVSYQPMIAENTISVEKEINYNNADFEQKKEYLFQTLIDLSNNHEVKQFLNEHKHDLILRKNNNYDYKNAVQKIHSKDPKVLKLILFTKPEMTYKYLEKNYNKGLEIVDILGKEESLKLVNTIKTNQDLFYELKNSIVNDKEISKKISALGEMNQELKSNPTSWSFPIICFILICCFLSLQFVMYTFLDLMDNALIDHKPLVFVLIAPFCFMSILTNIPIIYFLFLFNCDIPYEPPGS